MLAARDVPAVVVRSNTLQSATDAAEQLPEIDESRTAAMGGSFGGHMANWVAGHTDRFRANVTHASLWALDASAPPRTRRSTGPGR